MKKYRNSKNITGQTFGFLKAVSIAGKNKHRMTLWNCLCVCGKNHIVSQNALSSGNSKSCGCKHDVGLRHGHAAKQPDGRLDSQTYRAWKSMKDRCRNPKNRHYADYGGRGIKVCDEWMLFDNFLRDMGEAPKGLTLDRKDNDGNYEKSNCRWATMTQQNQNRRNSIILTINGITKPLAKWASEHGMSRGKLRLRVVRGWPESRLFT